MNGITKLSMSDSCLAEMMRMHFGEIPLYIIVLNLV